MPRILASALLCLVLTGAAHAQPRVFLMTDLQLRDPHAFAQVLFLCADVTDQIPLNLAPSLNESIAEQLAGDADGDGLLDLSPILASLNDQEIVTGPSSGGGVQWDPQDPGGELAFHFAACRTPQGSGACEQDPANPVQYAFYANAVQGTCLSPAAEDTSGYSPPVTSPAAPCLVTDPFAITLDVAGLHLSLEDAVISGTYVGDPPTDLVNGLIVGFLAEATADTILIAPSVPFVGGQPISSILPGGTGNCASQDDRDLGTDGVTPGWWLHFEFDATVVPFLPVGVPEATPAPAAGLELGAGVPNPFTETTTFAFALPQPGPARLRVHDVTGRLVATLVDGHRDAGRHAITWTGTVGGSAVAPGVYFVRLEAAGGAVMRRIVRLR